MPSTTRLRPLAVLFFLILLVGYVFVGFQLYQQYQAESALLDTASKTGPLWQTLRNQPVDDPEPVKKQVAEAQARVAEQQALFPKEAETLAVLERFLTLARQEGFFIQKLDGQAATQLKTKGGTYLVTRFAVQAAGNWSRLSVLFRRLAEQAQPVALGFENLAILVVPEGDEIQFDLLIYVRT